jgi:hypothetical protein
MIRLSASAGTEREEVSLDHKISRYLC